MFIASPRQQRIALAVTAVLLSASFTASASASAEVDVKLKTLSDDPYKNEEAYHRTALGPDTFSWGKTIVSVFQVGRFPGSGSDNVGFATSTDKGKSWTEGLMPGTTTYADPPGIFAAVGSPSIAYDAKHDVWLSNSVGRDPDLYSGFVNRSEDGGLSWSDPVIVKEHTGTSSYTRSWISCDNWVDSPNYGNCYVEASNIPAATILMTRSTDGGKTWQKDVELSEAMFDGKPVAQPDGTVVVPFLGDLGGMYSMVSEDGGKTYDGPYLIYPLEYPSGIVPFLRSAPSPTVDVDADGTVYVAWQDCAFRTDCSSNDIVMSTSADGVSWTGAQRVPIDGLKSTVDHFLPGLAVDRSTSGDSAHLALSYYYYPTDDCTLETCQLYAGYLSSTDGGAHWLEPTTLVGPITLTWLPDAGGRFVGDYMSTSIVKGKAYPVLVDAHKGTCQVGKVKSCDEFVVAPKKGLAVAAGATAVGAELPVFHGQPSEVPWLASRLD